MTESLEQMQERAEERGATRVEIRHLAAAVDELRAEVKTMSAVFAEARGGWRVIAGITGLGGALAGAIASLITKKMGQ